MSVENHNRSFFVWCMIFMLAFLVATMVHVTIDVNVMEISC